MSEGSKGRGHRGPKGAGGQCSQTPFPRQNLREPLAGTRGREVACGDNMRRADSDSFLVLE